MPAKWRKPADSRYCRLGSSSLRSVVAISAEPSRNAIRIVPTVSLKFACRQSAPVGASLIEILSRVECGA